MCSHREPTLESVKYVIILDNNGKRLFAKYYDDSLLLDQQKLFEQKLFKATCKQDSEIILMDNLTVVYKKNVDLYFYVIGSSNENELVLLHVLNCLYKSVEMVLNKNVEKKSFLTNFDTILLIVDILIDGGVIMEFSAKDVVKQIPLRKVEYTDQGIVQMIQSAKKQLFEM